MWTQSRLVRMAVVLAAAHVVVGVAMSVVGSSEGWLGGVFYAVAYAVPLLLIALALRSSRQGWRTVAGLVAVFFAAYYTLVVVGNWSGYTAPLAIFAVAITAPTVALDLLIFWATVLRRPRLAAGTRGGPASAG